MLLALVVVEFGLALFPFQLSPQWAVVNDVRYTDEAMIIGPRNRAQTSSSPPWVAEAREHGAFEVWLDARSLEATQSGPARILSVAGNNSHGNLTVSQDGADLAIQLRRRGSFESGEPRYVVSRTFADLAWHSIAIDVGKAIRVSVDGVVRISEPLPVDALDGWDPTYRLALGNSPDGERPWVGELRRAEVETRSITVDYTRPGMLEVPPEVVQGEVRPWEPIRPDSTMEIVIGVVHMLIFAPLGVVLRRLRHPPLPHHVILLGAVTLATAIQLAKTMFAFRHPALADILWFAVGALLGSICAAVAAGRLQREDDVSSGRRVQDRGFPPVG